MLYINVIHDITDTRVNAYIEMLKDVYGIDEFELADMLGIDRKTWKKTRESGAKVMSWGFLVSLAKATGISCDWLTGYNECKQISGEIES